MVPSDEGKCGIGCYCFEAFQKNTEGKFDLRLSLEEAWDRSVKGGYNRGCLVTWTPVGILINRLGWKTLIPEGATATDGGDQFCVNFDSSTLKTIAFDLDAVVASILGARPKMA